MNNNFNINNFNPNKSYVIEASAGTGKTYNIVEIVDSLVNKHNFKLNEILIVTYTEKATGELRDRIRTKINNSDIDNAPIYTIHSFCQNVIKEFGLSMNLPFNLNVIDESEINKFADRYLREGDILKDISKLISLGSDIKFNDLKDMFVKGVQKYYLNRDYSEDSTIIILENNSDASKDYNWFIDINTASCIEDLFTKYNEIEYYYNILKNSRNSNLNKLANEINQNFKDNFKFNGSKFKRPKEVNATFEEIKAYEFFKTKKEEKFNANETLCYLYLKDFYIKWQKEKEQNKNIMFDDMIRYVRESILHNEILKEKLKKKYSRAIIDEFQDTNQRQFDIFSMIFLEDDDHKMIVVGDPKQSIYSFQGADINVYYNAVDEIIRKGGEKCILNKNYRSTANMVNACNALFSYYDFDGTTFINSDTLNVNSGDEYEHHAKFENNEMNAIWIAVDKEITSFSEKETCLFSKIAVQQIIDCCTLDELGKTKLQIKEKNNDYRNVSFKDFAVLARTSNEMKYIERALKNAGIPFLRYKDKNLFLGRECAHWISLLEAINVNDFTGKNRSAFRKTLFTSFFGYSIGEIRSDYFNKDENFPFEKISDWKYMAKDKRWEDMFDDIIINSNIIENLKSLKELQSLSIYKQIANYCIDYLSNGKSLESLIRKLKSYSNGESVEEDDQGSGLVEKNTNFDCVQVMTIHASKGLQFPVVIAAGGFLKPYNRGNIYTYHMHDDITKKSFQKLCFKSNNYVEFEREAEWKRLFYVAYTRAQFLLILPYYDGFGMKFLDSSIEQLMEDYNDNIRFIEDNNLSFSMLRKESSKILSKTLNNKDSFAKEEQDKVLKEIINNSYLKRSYKHSYSSLSHHEEKDNEQIDNIVDEEIHLIDLSNFDTSSKTLRINYDCSKINLNTPFDYPKGTSIGVALHEIFEKIDFINYEENLTNIIKKSFIKQGILPKDTWLEYTSDIVKNVINAEIPLINGNIEKEEKLKLKDITLENRKDELEFNFNILNGRLRNFCNGFVDLIFKHGEYYSIVDWKSDTLNDEFISYSNLESIKNHVDSLYSIQRVLYSYCLIKWIKQFKKDLTEEEVFQKHFGGIYYIFLRGCIKDTSNGIYAQTWESWNDLENEFNKIVKEIIGGN